MAAQVWAFRLETSSAKTAPPLPTPPLPHAPSTPTPTPSLRHNFDNFVDKGGWVLRKMMAGISVTNNGFGPGQGQGQGQGTIPALHGWRSGGSGSPVLPRSGGTRAPAALGGSRGSEALGGPPSPRGMSSMSFGEGDMRIGSKLFGSAASSGTWAQRQASYPAPSSGGAACGGASSGGAFGESPSGVAGEMVSAGRAVSMDAVAGLHGGVLGRMSSSGMGAHGGAFGHGPGPSSLRHKSAPHLDMSLGGGGMGARRWMGKAGGTGRSQEAGEEGWVEGGGEARARAGGPSRGGSMVVNDPLLGELPVMPIRTGAVNAGGLGGHLFKMDRYIARLGPHVLLGVFAAGEGT